MAAVSLQDCCIRCEYSLVGLADDARCPECGLEVAASRRRTDLLRSADPPWVAKIARGLGDLSLAIWVVAGSLGAMLLLAVLGEVFRPLRWGIASRGGVGDWLLPTIGLLAMALHIRGCIRLAAAGHPDYAAAAPVRWVLLICGTAVPFLAGASALLGGSTPWMGAPFVILAQIVFLAFFFALAAALRHYEQHTGSWGSDRERRHRNVRKNLYGLIVLLILLMWVRGGIVGWRAGDPGLLLFGLAHLFLTLTMLRVHAAVRAEQAIAEAAAMARAERPDTRFI